MIHVGDVAELVSLVGQSLGVSDWVRIDQPMITRFAEATGDSNWYHIDIARASREMPDGKTIAHGWMLASLIPGLAQPLLQIDRRQRALNYGSNRIRFVTPVQVGSRVRLHVRIDGVERRPGAVLMTRACTLEIEGHAKPAMVAEVLTLVYE